MDPSSTSDSKNTFSKNPFAACRVALLYPGDRETRRRASAAESRFLALFEALTALGAKVEPAVYHDEFCDDVYRQLLQVDAVLVWMNPIEGGRDRSILDAMLRAVAAAGVFVSAHPDVILALGTKEVLYRTRELGWGCDTHLYRSVEQMRRELFERLRDGPRVLKQYRGNGGNGVWKVELADAASHAGPASRADEVLVKIRHAQRGCVEEISSLDQFYARCAVYFAGDGRMIDQAYQPRLAEGMVRCYLVHDRVAGFGHQAINTLYPAPAGAPPDAAPQPGPRLYHPPSLPEFQALKQRLEREWVPALQRLLGLDTARLPVLWDCDFLLGPKDASGSDSYVLCEINVSSVSPFPASAVVPVAEAAVAGAEAARRTRR